MEQLEDILARANLQQIATFLLYGDELLRLDPSDPVQRAEAAQNKLIALLEEAVFDSKTPDDILSAANEAYSVTGRAYLELGLKAAFRIMQQ